MIATVLGRDKQSKGLTSAQAPKKEYILPAVLAVTYSSSQRWWIVKGVFEPGPLVFKDSIFLSASKPDPGKGLNASWPV